MSTAQAEKRLGFRIGSLMLKAIPVETMLANARYRLDKEYSEAILNAKEKVYENIIDYLLIEGYQTEGDSEFKEANIKHLIYTAISPVLANFMRITGRTDLRLRGDKAIAATDGETGGPEEFVVVDLVSVEDERFILIVEAKRSSLGQAMKQCL